MAHMNRDRMGMKKDPVPSGPWDPSLWRVKTGGRDRQRQSADPATQGTAGGRHRQPLGLSGDRPKSNIPLTALGRTLAKALAPLCEWGTQYSTDVEAIMARRNIRERLHAA